LHWNDLDGTLTGSQQVVTAAWIGIMYSCQVGFAALYLQGPKHVYWNDLDGTLTGSQQVVTAAWPELRDVSGFDQGAPEIDGPCTHSGIFNAYDCLAGAVLCVGEVCAEWAVSLARCVAIRLKYCPGFSDARRVGCPAPAERLFTSSSYLC
jgi:hypothetical protein